MIAAKLETIGINLDPPKKPKNCGNSIFLYRLCKNATVPPTTIDPTTPVSSVASFAEKSSRNPLIVAVYTR